jgi:ketosteroid isomerase-like protein
MTQSTPIYTTPFEAEAAFYNALERMDINAMMDVWADDDTVICVHPFSERHHGREEVAQGWRDHFATANTQVRIELNHPQYTQTSRLAVHVLYQYAYVGPGRCPQPPSIVTNIYKLTPEGWRMVMHQASPTAIPERPRESAMMKSLH